MMKNAFYYTLKALFVLKTFNFCLDVLGMYKKGLIRKIRLISNFMTSGNNQLQYAYCSVSQKVKAIRQ